MQQHPIHVAGPLAAQPAGPVVVGLDGGYVRSRHRPEEHLFEVLAGKVIDGQRAQVSHITSQLGNFGLVFCRACRTRKGIADAHHVVLLPVLFVMGLGYWAGCTKRFDADQTRGLNELVMTYALPSLMFVAVVTTTRSEMIAEARFLLAVLIAFLGLYIVVALLSTLVLHHNLGVAGLRAFLVTFPSVAFFGVPIFEGLFGEASLLSIASADVLASVTIVPLTVVLLEIHAQHAAGSEVKQAGVLIRNGLTNSLVKPMVWAPLLGTVFVVLDIDFPKEIDKMLSLIGSTTGGASLFLAGLIISSYSIKLNVDVAFNIVGKMVLQPALMAFLVWLLAIPNPLGREAILICAIPASAVAPMLAARYQVYETEASSTVVLDSLLMLVTYTTFVLLTGA